MKKALISVLILMLGTLVCTASVFAQTAAPADVEELPPLKSFDDYDDFIVKGYSISFSGGYFAGATYLDNPLLGPRVFYTKGANDIMRYFPTEEDGYGDSLPESTFLDSDNHFIYDAAQKEVEPGDVYNLRVGIYIADNFHLDIAGAYINSRASTTMMHLYAEEPERNVREEVDFDDGFKVYKGGFALMYDAVPATYLGITPRLGFGLGGIINRFSQLEDKTALYLEGNFALNYNLFKNVDLSAQVDYATFAFDVDELGYSNMVHYTSFSLGAIWFVDVLPSDIRAAHEADKR